MIEKSLSAIGGVLVLATLPLAVANSGWCILTFLAGLFLVDNFGTIEENTSDF